jgi:hypothetical protein
MENQIHFNVNGYLLLIIGGAVVLFVIFAMFKGWVSWRGGRGIATLTAFHDLQPKDKQEAIEYVMEEKAGKKMQEQESGEKKDDA